MSQAGMVGTHYQNSVLGYILHQLLVHLVQIVPGSGVRLCSHPLSHSFIPRWHAGFSYFPQVRQVIRVKQRI